MTMSRTQKLLEWVGTTGRSEIYSNREHMEAGLHTTVYLSAHDFEDMEQPAQITVTIVPGDKLNEVTQPEIPGLDAMHSGPSAKHPWGGH